MLKISDLTYRVAGRPLFERASAAIPDGAHVGLVGRNGAGKTTLLRLILGELDPDGGEIEMSSGLRLGTVAQELPDTRTSLLDLVLAADRERGHLLAEAEHATDPQRIADIHHRLADIEAHRAAPRAARILAGLGFDDAAQARPLSDFSGGWRMRVALAAALFASPDLLLLDEPTNHLDLEATLWLENYLTNYPHTVVVVSHDRELLNKVVDRILHVDGGKLTLYNGGYDRFENTRRERIQHQMSQNERQLAERKRIQAFVDRFRAKATKARQAQSRLKALQRMEPIVAVAEEKSISFDFPSPEPLPAPLLTLDEVDAGYETGKPVLQKLSLRIDSDDRIALLGANGNGKSTLVKLLAGRLKPLQGQRRASGKLRVGYFAQHQADELDLDATPYQLMLRLMPRATESQVRAQLGRFGFSQERAEVKVGSLSGGEKARLLFALMSRNAPHLMLLDEPTNHLDLDAREAVVEALNAYQGAVVLVSHDPHLIELSAERLWLVKDGAVGAYDGDLEDYRALLLSERRASADEGRAGRNGTLVAEPAGYTRSAKKDQRRAAADARAATSGLRKSAQAAEKRLERLQAECRSLEAQLADPEIYRGPTAALMTLQIKLGDTKKSLADAEQAWLAAQDALERAGAPAAASNT
ncbi:MAG TPA: ABC-F family ATP-binding cassette domain-containing protein [Alphaproteobacteria bacterium]|nr:ABC-F family ATP-binding cassette domain-containing protein [Alphaproteobacteria bacterium]